MHTCRCEDSTTDFFILGQPYDFNFVFDSTFVVPTVRYHQGDSQPNFKFLIYFKTRQLERSFEIHLGCCNCHPSSLTHCQMRLGFAQQTSIPKTKTPLTPDLLCRSKETYYRCIFIYCVVSISIHLPASVKTPGGLPMKREPVRQKALNQVMCNVRTLAYLVEALFP